MEQLGSEDQSVVLSHEVQVIEDLEEKSVINRAQKLAGKVLQSQLFGEFDFFGSNIKLNFNGQQNYKTQFGGFLFLMIAVTSVTLTIIYMFPNGFVINTKISQYSMLIDDMGQGMNVFDHSDTFFRVYLWNKTSGQTVKGSQKARLLQGVSAWQLENGKPTGKLDLTYENNTGYYYFNKTPTNSAAQVYGTKTAQNNASIHVEIITCDFYDTDPVYTYCGMNFYLGLVLAVDVITFDQTTGSIVPKYSKIPVNTMWASNVPADMSQYTTNSKFFGYIANVMNYEIDYFYVWPAMFVTSASSAFPIYDPTFNCINTRFNGNFRCSTFNIAYSGTVNISNEIFDDITAPLLFFIALSQTLFFLVYVGFLRNYNNNCLKLRLADSIVYILDPDGRHYNFKGGFSIFMACMLHGHLLIRLLDLLLYRVWETHYRRFLPIRAQMALRMIEYGQNCMTDRFFFGELNDMYSQENAQPSKIIFDYDKKEEEEEEEEEEPETYFDDAIKEEAFKRMCEEHQYYSVSRKKYLRDLLQENDKRYKLVLMTQKIFEEYCAKVRSQGLCKEIELPITFQNEELSGANLKKENFY